MTQTECPLSPGAKELVDELTDLGATFGLAPGGKLKVGPRAVLNKSLKKRIKKHRREIAESMYGAVEFENDVSLCRVCHGVIRDTEASIGFEVDGVESLLHTDYECQKKGAEMLYDLYEPGKVMQIHMYHACDDEGNGYGCRGHCFKEVCFSDEVDAVRPRFFVP